MYAQFGEDDIIAQYFPQGYVGSCIDVGAANGVSGNNSYLFEEKKWITLCVEANPALYAQCKAARTNTVNYAVSNYNKDGELFTIYHLHNGNEEAVSSLNADKRLIDDHASMIKNTIEISVNVRTLDSIIEETSLFKTIDFVSIDTEGTELDVLKGFDINKWKPRLFVIENNYNNSEIEEYLTAFSYKKDKRNAVNDFYLLID
jgi:FkbM family methyltransferase